MGNYDLGDALNKTEALLRKLVILKSDEHYWALTLWIAFCYAIRQFDFAPKLVFWSPEKRCGKSLALEVVSHLIPNPLLTSSISSAGLFRLLARDETKVIFIDESDTVFGKNGDKEKAEALRQLLNSSFKRGMVVIRCEPPKYEPKEFKIFAPIALAGIGKNAIPETTVDRALMIEMRRMLPSETILEFESDEIETVFGETKKLLESFTLRHSGKYRSLRPELPRDSLNARARDVWKPLYKVAECSGEEWKVKVRTASLALSAGEAEPEESSLSLRLLSDIREVFIGDRMATKELIGVLMEMEEAPWKYLERFNPSILSRMLRNYGVKPHSFSGKVRGYFRSGFEDPWKRYLVPLEGVIPVIPVILDKEEQAILDLFNA